MNKQLLLTLTVLIGTLSLQAQDSLPPFKPFQHYINRESMFEKSPTQPGAIIFLGNSITNNWEWAEFFAPSNGAKILNRGIGGDVTAGVLHRLDEVARHTPSKIFLMIGINDLNGQHSNEEIVQNIDRIITTLQKSCPQTKLYLQSILPVNKEIFKQSSTVQSSDNIRAINAELAKVAQKRGIPYIDLFSLMLDPNTDMLYASYTTDGIHLTATAYLKWIKEITPLVNK